MHFKVIRKALLISSHLNFVRKLLILKSKLPKNPMMYNLIAVVEIKKKFSIHQLLFVKSRKIYFLSTKSFFKMFQYKLKQMMYINTFTNSQNRITYLYLFFLLASKSSQRNTIVYVTKLWRLFFKLLERKIKWFRRKNRIFYQAMWFDNCNNKTYNRIFIIRKRSKRTLYSCQITALQSLKPPKHLLPLPNKYFLTNKCGVHLHKLKDFEFI